MAEATVLYLLYLFIFLQSYTLTVTFFLQALSVKKQQLHKYQATNYVMNLLTHPPHLFYETKSVFLPESLKC